MTTPLTNKEYSEEESFREKCKQYNTTPTKRQASKYRLKKGRLYKREKEKE